MKTKRVPIAGDYIKTISDRFTNGPWRGKIRRQDVLTEMYLIEWAYSGGLPTDICTWVFADDLRVTRRLKPIPLERIV